MTGKVDVADLTWEQKERVLRFLFARMNGTPLPPSGMPRQQALPPISVPIEEHRYVSGAIDFSLQSQEFLNAE